MTDRPTRSLIASARPGGPTLTQHIEAKRRKRADRAQQHQRWLEAQVSGVRCL